MSQQTMTGSVLYALGSGDDEETVLLVALDGEAFGIKAGAEFTFTYEDGYTEETDDERLEREARDLIAARKRWAEPF
jgi:hypothetical protein